MILRRMGNKRKMSSELQAMFPKRGLLVNYLGERQNLKNRRVEILITNHQARHTLF